MSRTRPKTAERKQPARDDSRKKKKKKKDEAAATHEGILRSPTTKRLIRAYGPVLVIVLLFVLMAVLVPTIDRPVP